MRMSEQTNDFITALSKFQGSITPPPKNREVDTGKYKFKYAELDSILEHIKVPFAANGFSWFSGLSYPQQGAPFLTTRVNHISGQWLETDYRLPAGGDTKQFAGEVTYGRRYCFSMLLGLSSQQDADELPPPPRGQQAPPQNHNRAGQGQRPQGQLQQRAPQSHAGLPTGQPTNGAAGATPSAAAAPNQAAQLGEQRAPAANPTTQPTGSVASAPPAGPSVASSSPTSNGSAFPTKPIAQADWDALCVLVADQTRFNPWNMEQLGEYMKARYQRAKLGQYSRAEYDELMEAVGALTFNQAMELTVPATNEPGAEG